MDFQDNQSFKNYLEKRNGILEAIQKHKYGDLTFTQEEEKANDIFRKKLIEERSKLPVSFFRENTMKYLDLIEKNEIFLIVKKMPKGGVLHLHTSCCFEISWVFFSIDFFYFELKSLLKNV